MIIVESATWRIGCKHPRERGREAGSSELLYQLDGRCYFLSRQPISVRSVKDGHRTTEVRQETTPDSIMSFVGAYVHKYTNRNTHTSTNLEVFAQFNREGLNARILQTPCHYTSRISSVIVNGWSYSNHSVGTTERQPITDTIDTALHLILCGHGFKQK